MTAGIYCLYFKTDDNMFYVGQSVNIEMRYSAHCRALKSITHRNYILQELFNKYAVLPQINILEIVDDYSSLDDREVYWIKEIDSYRNGINLTGGGGSSFGEEHSGAQYTNEIYFNVMKKCAESGSSLINISRELDVSLNVVRNISCGNSHAFLKSIDPILYSKMLANNGTRVRRYDTEDYALILQLLANTDISLKELSDTYEISLRVLQDIAWGRRHQHLQEEFPEEYKKVQERIGTRSSGKQKVKTSFINKEGKVVSYGSLSEFCDKHHLNISNISRVYNGHRQSHRGWKLWSP